MSIIGGGVKKRELDRAYKDGYPFKRDSLRFIVSDDTAVVVPDAPADGTTYNKAYARGTNSTPPTDWPVYSGRSTQAIVSGVELQYQPNYYGYRVNSVMMDGDKLCLYLYVTAGMGLQVWSDGQPLSATPWSWSTTGFKFVTIVFSSAKPRRIDFGTSAALHTVYTQKPYRLWKPVPHGGPCVAVIGDSWTVPTVFGAGGSVQTYVNYYGLYQQLAPYLGLDEIICDAVGGTGYLKASGAIPNYYNRWLGGDAIYKSVKPYNPDVVIVHGGGANDLYNSFTVSQIIDQAVLMFTQMRADLPKAKLVFVEGFAPPGFPFNTQYQQIREGVQAALTSIGVYYIDVATSAPWIEGLGNASSPNGDNKNANIYAASDGAHLTIAGNIYVRARMANALRAILRDRGTLLNQLVTT